MAFSVNTNPGAFAALQNLNKTNRSLETTQDRINTGLKVGSSKDNAAIFAIAQKLRGNVAGLNAVKGSIDRALSTLDVAISAGEAVSDLLIEMKEKAVAAKDPSQDSDSLTALDNDFQQLKAQITSIVNTAEFSGTNAVDGTGNVTAITDETGTSANQITVTAADLSLSTLSLSAAVLTSTSDATTSVTNIEAAIDTVNQNLSRLGAGAKRLELQKEFTTKLSDAIEVGIGNLVDADLAKESASLQSLQVKQQLGLQALSIANQAPSTTLSLFR